MPELLTNLIINFGNIILLLNIKEASLRHVRSGATSCSSVVLVPGPRG